MKFFKKYISRRPSSFGKNSGVTLLELLIATGISAIVITSVMGTIGSIYFTQKKVRFTQNFYAESRILMERVSQFARNNTLDYDRYFIEVGPDSTSCSDFDPLQAPSTMTSGDLTNNSGDSGNRAALGYSNIFYWDTTGDGVQDRNLGGATTDGSTDACAAAFNGNQTTLYLINGVRTLRTAIRNKDDYDDVTETVNDLAEDYRIEVERQLGADTDNDFIADMWGPYDADGDGDYSDLGDIEVVWESNICSLKESDGTKWDILGDETSADFCRKAHVWTSISPKPIKIARLEFIPSPTRDPFLNFRIASAQVHPNVFINMETDLRDPGANGFEVGQQPKLSFQTAVSSRVFGNTR